MKHVIFLLAILMAFTAKAQIGYQVTVLDTATGEPRANETITATISISDAAGGTICSDVKTATTDEFGVLSLEVGNSGTFANVDWNKLPLYISATVDGVMIGRTQVLSVPVAEYAKQTGTLTKEILCSKTWTKKYNSVSYSISFSQSGSFSFTMRVLGGDVSHSESKSGTYSICGNTVACAASDNLAGMVFIYIPQKNGMFGIGSNCEAGFYH